MQIVVRQISGLGNQLFQYAAGRYYANRYHAQLSLVIDRPENAVSHGYPRPFLLSNFSLAAACRDITTYDRFILVNRKIVKPLASAAKSALGIQTITETLDERYTFQQDIPIRKGVRAVYLVGYWQAYRFPDSVANELRAEFCFREPAQDKNLEVLRCIQQSTNSVSLHIRRGDYTLAAEGNIALPLDYYYRSIRLFKERFRDPKFFVFSDDIDFARRNLPSDIEAVFVDHNDSLSAHEDLRLMSACDHHIIANSSFSWWGAWLNARADKIVVAPRHWHLDTARDYPDLLPPSWISIDHS